MAEPNAPPSVADAVESDDIEEPLTAEEMFEPDCRTPEQMRWANGLCRFRELATTIDLGQVVRA